MWRKHGKKIAVFLVIAVNTLIIGLIINYSKRNDSLYNEQIASDIKNRTIEIHDEEDYLAFAETVTEENDYNHWVISLCSDLDFTEYQTVKAIGDVGQEEPVMFMGTINGNGHKIS